VSARVEESIPDEETLVRDRLSLLHQRSREGVEVEGVTLEVQIVAGPFIAAAGMGYDFAARREIAVVTRAS